MSKFKPLQKDVCDLPVEEAPVKVCPTCTIDPNYVEPVWYETLSPYLNLSICEYQVSVTSTERPGTAINGAHLDYLAQKSVKKGVREIIRYFSKLELDSIVCAFPPSRSSQVCRLYLPPELLVKFDQQGTEELPDQVNGDIRYNKDDPENRFNLDALEIKAYVKEVHYGDNFEQFKVLVSIPAEDIDTLEESPFSEEDKDEIISEARQVEDVVLDGRSFKNNILQLKAVFKLYAKYQSLYYTLQKVSLLQDVGEDGFKKLRLTRFPNQFENFKDALEDVLEDNDFKLRRHKGRKVANKIKIVFDDSNRLMPYKIKQVYAKYPGCKYKRLKNIEPLKRISENQTLMHYIANIEDMVQQLDDTPESVPWLDYIARNTYPPVTIDFGNADSKNEELDSCIDDQYLADIKDRILEEALNFKEAIEFQFSTHNCQTLQDYDENNLVSKTLAKMKREKLTREERKAKRAEKKYTRQQNREDREAERERKKQERERIANDIEDLEKDISSFGLYSDIQRLQDLYKKQASAKNPLSDIEILQLEIKALKKSVRLLKKTLPPTLSNSAGGIESILGTIASLDQKDQMIQDIEEEIQTKKEELARLQKISRNKNFPLTEALSTENIKKLWKEAHGPEPKKKGLFRKMAEQRSLNVKDRQKLKETRSGDREQRRLTEGLKNKRDIRKKQGRTILARINPCDWSAVLFEVIECLLGGMSLEEAVPIIIRTTLSKSSPFVLETILQGLPPEVQEKVENEVKAELKAISDEALKAFKTPWDSAREQQKDEEDSGDNTKERDRDLQEATPESDSLYKDEDVERFKAEVAEINQQLADLQNRLSEILDSDLEPEEQQNQEEQAPPPPPPKPPVEWMEYKHRYKYEPSSQSFFWKQWTSTGGLPADWTAVTNSAGIQAVKQTWDLVFPNQTPPWESQSSAEDQTSSPEPIPSSPSDQLQVISQLESEIEALEEKKRNREAIIERESGQPPESSPKDSFEEAKEKRKKSAAPRGVLDLSKIASIIFNAYVDALVQYAGIDDLTAMIDKIPGANVFKKIFLQVACPTADSLKFGVEDLFGSLKIGVCNPDSTGYLLPSIPKLPPLKFIGINAVLDEVIKQFKQALVRLVEAVILALFVKILEYIDKAQCQAIGALGGLIANQVAGQDGTRNGLLDAINDAFCGPDGNPEDTQDDLLSRAGMPSEAKAGIANGISKSMSPREIKQALLNCENIPKRVWAAIYAVIQAEYPDLLEFISGPDDVKEIFCTMGSLMSPDQRDVLEEDLNNEADEAQDGPIDSSVCLDNEEREAWDQRRVDFYENQGLPREAAEEFIDALNGRAQSDLSDLLDLLVNGPEGLLDDFFEKAFAPPDPDCTESLSIIPKPPQQLLALQKQVSEGMFGSISTAFKRDMIGNRNSMIDNILADSRGLRLTGFLQHESRVNFDLLFPNAANSVEDHREKYDKSGYLTRALMAQSIFPKDEFEENQDGDPPRPDANHLFPQTIGLYCRERLLQLAENIEFQSTEAPAFTLGFRDISEDEDYAFDKGFNLNYRNYAKSNSFNRSGVYSIKKVDINRVKKDKKQKTTDFNIRVPYGFSNNQSIIRRLDAQEDLDVPYINHLFKRYMQEAWSNSVDISSNNFSSMYDSLNTVIIKKLTQSLLADPRSSDNLPTGFKFGYNDDKVTYEDLLYVNPEATDDPETWEYTYENEDKVLGKSATNHKRVKFLDPQKYGGRYTRPKIYIEAVNHDGWFRILQAVVPELDGCEPRRTDFLKLEEVAERVSSLQNSIKPDKRMEFDKDCIHQPPFDKLLPPASLAYIEGAITAIIRTYVVEALLRSMPIISQLKLDFTSNYDAAFLSLVVDRMETQMTEQGGVLSRIKNYTYWILFLDQVVQMSFRRIKDGTLPKDEELLSLLKRANEVSKNYLRPDRDDIALLRQLKRFTINEQGDINGVTFKRNKEYSESITKRAIRIANSMAYYAYGELYQDELKKKISKGKDKIKIKTLKLKVLVDACREYQVHKNKALCKSILRYSVKTELERYGDILNEVLIPQCYIQNLSKFFLGASGICKNHNLSAGLSEVESPVGDSSLPYGDINEVVENPMNRNPLEGVELTDEDKKSGVFFLEKYLVITPRPVSAASAAQDLEERYPTQYRGVTGIKQFQDELRSYSGDTDRLISESMGNAQVILEDSSDSQYVGSIGIKFGVRLCYSPPKSFSASGATTVDRAFRAKPLEGYAGSAYYFPVASYEQDISDRKLSEIDLEDPNLGEELKCYVDRLSMTEEFDFFVNKLLMTRRVSSMMAIYFYDGFIDSLGLGENEREEGKESRGNERWKGKILDDTKDRCRALFASFYRTMDTDKNSTREARERNTKGLFANLMPKGLFNIDGSVKWWQRARIVDRPYDRDGKDCANELMDIFGG